MIILLLFSMMSQSSDFDRYFRRGEQWMDKQDWARARTSFEQARRIKRTNDLDRRIQIATARLFVEEGDRYLRKAAYAEASDRYARALNLDPEYAPAQRKRTQALGSLACANGYQMMDKGDLEGARRQFLDCIAHTPNAMAYDRLRSVEASLDATARMQDLMKSVNSLAMAHRWNALDPELRRLSALVEMAPVVPREVAAGWPAIFQYAHGNINAAAKLARASDRIGSLAEFFQNRRRLYYATMLATPLLAVYSVMLLASLYFGIRRALP